MTMTAPCARLGSRLSASPVVSPGPSVIGVVVPERSQVAVNVLPLSGVTVSSEMKPPLVSGSIM